MAKTVWECEACGEQFNSRAARLYHRNHTCSKIEHAPTPDPAPVVPIEEKPILSPPPKPEPQKVKYDPRPAADLTVDEDEPAVIADEADDIPYILLIPAILIIGLIAGLLIFRDKIFGLFRRPPKPTGAI